MMSFKRRSGISFVVSLLIGLLLGALYANRTVGRGLRLMSEWSAIGAYGQLAELEYRFADETHARNSLADFLRFAEQVDATGKVSDRRAFAAEIARTQVRLAVLDRNNGDDTGYQSNISKAHEALGSVGGDRDLAEVVKRVAGQRNLHQ